MKAIALLILWASISVGTLQAAAQKELPKIAIWDLDYGSTTATHHLF